MKQFGARARGFTLIELMLVVAIIGILAAVALPQYLDYVIRSRVSEGFTLAREAQLAVAAYYDRWGRLPTDNAAAGMARPEAYRGSGVASLTVEGGMVVIRFDAKALPADYVGGTRVYLRPAINRAYPTGALAWVCNDNVPVAPGFDPAGAVGKDIMASRYVPTSCRGPQ